MKVVLSTMHVIQTEPWWQKISSSIDAVREGFKEVPHTRNQFYDLCAWQFEHTSDMITSFPLNIIQDDRTLQLVLAFSAVSAGLVAVFSIGEGLKGVLGMQYTKFSTFIGRTVVSFLGAALTLPAMIFAMNTLTIICRWMLSLGHGQVSGTVLFSSALSEMLNDGAINFTVSIFFMIAFLIFSMKAMLDTGLRWFDMIIAAVASPMAWSCLTTDSTKSFFTRWLRSTAGLYLTNVVYAFYLTVIMALVLAPWQVNTIGVVSRFVLILGAFLRLVKPPAWVGTFSGGGEGALKTVIDVLVLRRLRRKP